MLKVGTPNRSHPQAFRTNDRSNRRNESMGWDPSPSRGRNRVRDQKKILLGSKKNIPNVENINDFEGAATRYQGFG